MSPNDSGRKTITLGVKEIGFQITDCKNNNVPSENKYDKILPKRKIFWSRKIIFKLI